MTTLLSFLAGATTMGFCVAALFFLRFWRNTRDGLFLSFAVPVLPPPPPAPKPIPSRSHFNRST